MQKQKRMMATCLWLVMVAWAVSACSLSNIGGNGGAVPITGLPTVRIAAPQPNATYLEGVRVNIQALVANAGSDITRVEVAVDGAVIQTLENPNPTGAAQFSVTAGWDAAAAGAHTASVAAFRADGSRSEPTGAEVAFSVVADEPTETATATPSPTQANSPTPRPTQAESTDEAAANAEATEAEGTEAADAADSGDTVEAASGEGSSAEDSEAGDTAASSGTPQATFNQGVNVRRGPSTLFVPPIGSFAAGQTAEITAVNPAGDWLRVRYYNSDGWVFASLATVNGDLSSLPRDPGPALPTSTPVPAAVAPAAPPAGSAPLATNAPAGGNSANLVAGIIVIEPSQPRCAETFLISVDVANLGSSISGGGSISVTDVQRSSGAVQQTTNGAFGAINPGETRRIGPIPLTVSTFSDEEHELRLVIDPDNRVPETVEGDNTGTLTYTLARGNCP